MKHMYSLLLTMSGDSGGTQISLCNHRAISDPWVLTRTLKASQFDASLSTVRTILPGDELGNCDLPGGLVKNTSALPS